MIANEVRKDLMELDLIEEIAEIKDSLKKHYPKLNDALTRSLNLF